MFCAISSSLSMALYCFTAPMTFFRSCSFGILLRSSTMAFTFLAPMTAPTPPRAARREGRRSVSLNEIPARSPRYSPTGPQMPRLTFLPKRSCSFAAQSKFDRPIRSSAEEKLTSPSRETCITVHSPAAPCSVNPARPNWPRAKPKVPPAFASLIPPVNGLRQPTLTRLALEKLVPANGPTEKIRGLSPDSGSTLAAPHATSSRAMK